MKIDPFIFNWVGNFHSARKIEMQLSYIFEDITVINSDDSNRLFHWKNIGNESFFTAQWFKCLELHDPRKILFHVQADTQYDYWDQLVRDALHYMEKYNAGIYYPRVSNTNWSNDKSTVINGHTTADANIKCIVNGDETVWFIHPKVIKYFKEHNIIDCFSENKIGWGWDVVFCGISHILGMPVIRDSNHEIKHRKHRGYNHEQAFLQFRKLLESLPYNLKSYAHHSRRQQRHNFIKEYLSNAEHIST